MRVLVVDDDPAILRMCANVLQKSGHDVVTCDGGATALQHALMRELDLALCDLNLPDMHGLDVIRAIKVQAPALPIIVMSALDATVWAPLSTEAGAAQFLQKPLRIDMLRTEVAMADAARANLTIAIVDGEEGHTRRIALAFQQQGCLVRTYEVPMQVCSSPDPPPTLVVVDGTLGGAEALVRWARVKGVAAVVVLPRDRAWAEEPFMRTGASLVLGRPVDANALMVQARFLVAR